MFSSFLVIYGNLEVSYSRKMEMVKLLMGYSILAFFVITVVILPEREGPTPVVAVTYAARLYLMVSFWLSFDVSQNDN